MEVRIDALGKVTTNGRVFGWVLATPDGRYVPRRSWSSEPVTPTPMEHLYDSRQEAATFLVNQGLPFHS